MVPTKFIKKGLHFNKFAMCKVKEINQNTNSDVNEKSDFMDLTLTEGFENFSKMFLHSETQEFIRKSDGIIILGDIVYPEVKYLAIDRVILAYSDKWIQRLKCCWNLLFNILQKANLIKINNNENSKCQEKSKDKKTKSYDKDSFHIEVEQKL